ncbi:MAG TPA: hypothetical protein VKB78_10440, partial [Pirellulales bacterium]|nr:hypothetical protein [Pirellulales bacterium]
VRFVADRFGRRADVQSRSETESDMSPGVLLSTGYIAGGAIAGMVVAFLSFNDTIPNWLGQWQNREATVAAGTSFRAQIEQIAAEQLGYSKSTASATETDRQSSSTPIAIPQSPAPAADAAAEKARDKAIRAMAQEIIDLNRPMLAELAPVPAGTAVKLPSGETYVAPRNEKLGDLAKEVLKSESKATLLLDLNEDRIQPPQQLEPGTMLKLPQRTLPALAAFSVLALLLLAVGVGWLFAGDSSANTRRAAKGPAAQTGDGSGQRPSGRKDDIK